MVRAPCCAKEGLKRGPWSRDEDNILTSYIHQHGHSNWRALPKLAGLLRCGKSCRLRWANYLRPDIKRGNFSKEEEDTIIQLHHVLGNRWSAIAGKLPGRTDNEIKNVWHTHLKKKLQNNKNVGVFKGQSESLSAEFVNQPDINTSSQQSSINVEVRDSSNVFEDELVDISSEAFLDESFWTDAFSADISIDESSTQLAFPLSPFSTFGVESSLDSKMYDGMDFWFDVLVK